jgi:hypothetical protein
MAMTEDEIKNNQERVRAQLDIVLNIIEQENSSFLGIGSLAIALIVILSLSNNLISFSLLEGKVLLTIFLFLIVITLGTHLLFLSKGKKKSIAIIDEIIGKKTLNQLRITYFEKIIAYIPKVVTTIFFICIAYIIYVLWR